MLISLFHALGIATLIAGSATPLQQPVTKHSPSAHQHRYSIPHHEPIEITSIPLPPVVDSEEPGACSFAVNSHGTGCIGQTTGLQAGNFLPDGNHILATVKFVGAPSAPDPRSVFQGQHLLVLKADGTLFQNGDTWKCLTCGVPDSQNFGQRELDHQYPQAFSDGKRVLTGSFILDCGQTLLTSEECGPEQVFVYPIRLENKEDGSGPGAFLRELRLHPDGLHLGFNVFSFVGERLGQTAYVGRLQFNASPSTSSPDGPRYDLIHVNHLYDPSAPQPVIIIGDGLVVDRDAITVGELRGFSGTGQEVLYLGYPYESCNMDVFAAHLTTGKVRRLTSHPGYVDPVQMSANDQSIVIMDTRSADRTTFMAGLRGVPPIIDQITTMACSSVRNNGDRRFFQPYLLDRHGDHDGYYGQEINSASSGTPGSGDVDDPEWNGRADPWFSPDGTRIVYWQAKTVAPACGGENPLPCYDSREPGGRTERVMIAHLTSRKPIEPHPVLPMPDVIPWAVPYVAGQSDPARQYPREGNYTLKGTVSGYASVSLKENAPNTHLRTVSVSYHAYSDDGRSFLHGTQNVTEDIERMTLDKLEWHSNLTWTGEYEGSQSTSPDGFRLSIDVMKNEFQANGTLKTVVGGVEYLQPENGQ
ncbi:hypothetical protein MBLNU13_g08927t1 [Cladosporium sp. NU13]